MIKQDERDEYFEKLLVSFRQWFLVVCHVVYYAFLITDLH